MTTLLQDLRYAIRISASAPGFTAVAVAVLTLGIGANSAAFSIVNALLFRPLSGSAGTLVSVHTHDRERPGSYRPFSYPNYADLRDSGVFDVLMAQAFTSVAVPAGDEMRRTFAALVSANYFEAMGVRLAAGRPFSAAEALPGANLPVVITNHDAWKAAGLTPSFVGSTLRINARDFTVIGVAPEGFTGTTAIAAPEIWMPLGMFDEIAGGGPARRRLGDRATIALSVAGRLPAGVTAEAAAARLAVVSAALERAYPVENRGQILSTSALARLTPGVEPESDSELTPIAALVVGLCAIVLLVASLNVANMLLARGAARRREIALRIALGASRARVIRQLVTESVLLAAVAAAGGLLLSYWAMRTFAASLRSALPLALSLDPLPDLPVVGATAAVALGGVLVFGLGPAWRASRTDLVSGLKGAEGRRGRCSGRNALVVVQLALSLALVVAGGLFARAALQAGRSDPGFPYEGALLATTDAALGGLTEARTRASHRDILERVRALPGVRAAAMASSVPFGHTSESCEVAAVGPDAPTTTYATYRIVSSGYFAALGRAVLRGREFTQTEERSAGAPAVAIVDEALARRIFGGRDALGESLRVAAGSDDEGVAPLVFQIVGIAPPIREDVTSHEPGPHVYVPSGRDYRAAAHLHVRAADGQAAAVLSATRRTIRAVEPQLPVLGLTTMGAFHRGSLPLWVLQAGGTILSLLGAVALVLAIAGVYGLRSYVVSTRTRELCIRMAVGASRRDILWLVLRDAVALTLAGLSIGLPIAFASSIVLNSVMWGFTRFDPLVFTAAPALLVLAALAASYVPARRAMRMEPIAVLRHD